MSIGVFAMMGLTNHSTVETMDAIGRIFHMPYVTSSAPGYERAKSTDSLAAASAAVLGASRTSRGYTIYMSPVYGQAVFDVIRYQYWTRVQYIYDSDEGT